MGKPYERELAELPNTYAWAMEAPIAKLAEALSECSALPLIAIGSGGSLTAAEFACHTHQRHLGITSKAITPMEFMGSPTLETPGAVILLSAGGTNPDIVDCARFTIFQEPKSCIFFCLRKGSQLARLARRHSYVGLVEYGLPTVKDGFLATNSLLAFCVILTRAYDEAFSKRTRLPRTFQDFASLLDQVVSSIEVLSRESRLFSETETLLVLYGPSMRPAAMDLASKFAEGAFGNLILCDIRNFAHGVHNWLARHERSTGIVVLAGPDESSIAEKTLALLPKSIPVLRINPTYAGPAATIGALLAIFHLIGWLGRNRGIDPGRPKIPDFGRRIYRMRAFRDKNYRSDLASIHQMSAVRRKLRSMPGVGRDEETQQYYSREYAAFANFITKANVRAVILDYDGTICEPGERFTGVRAAVAYELNRLLGIGIHLGVATGRGKSVRESLHRVIKTEFLSSVFIGYYNCSDIGRLDDNEHPDNSRPCSDALARLATRISDHTFLSNIVSIEARSHQLSVQPKHPRLTGSAFSLLKVLADEEPGIRLVVSSHSIDVLEGTASKLQLMKYLEQEGCPKENILTIGDRGAPPGNDYLLLKQPLGLSVDEVSSDPQSCWNLAPLGHRGVQATIDYLKALVPTAEGCRLDFSLLLSPPRD